MYHVRQLDSGFTTRQLTSNFRTFGEARKAADKEERKEGEDYSVCISLELTDKRNVKGEGRFGFLAVDNDQTV